jgi:hypothetical protein
VRGPKMRLRYVVGRMGGPKVRFSSAIKMSEPEAILICVVGRICGPKARLKCVCVCACVCFVDGLGGSEC